VSGARVRKAWEEAVRRGDAAALDRLLAAGADVDAKDPHGQTGLMVAARDGRAAVVDLLVARGAALDHTAKYRLSALMLAVLNGHAGIARALVAAGADLSLRGSGAPGFDGLTAADLAARIGRRDLVDAMRRDAGERG
jgi:ankyrin repeat protein